MIESTSLILFLIILPVVSFLYSSVGHGGASGYLALMVLFSFPSEIMKSTALLLNLFVSGIAFYQYYKAGHFNKKLFIYFAIGSIPSAFFGGKMDINPDLYRQILGVLLIFAIVRMLWKKNQIKRTSNPHLIIAILFGITIGFFSGLIGIGGGIILTPLILLFRWGTMKEAAAVSALFIWVNSASALFGQFNLGINLYSDSMTMVLLAFFGGLIGSYYGSKKWKSNVLEYLLVVVLTIASIKLLLL
ncbi:MAG TPA: sulfite exporter TauE/SafE family protein [Cytophagales bacterium]|jgi:uncharacterized membrane protein YfcA|nr:sulfite exporter TauE/SafE family protein [Cytophagales bacterium]